MKIKVYFATLPNGYFGSAANSWDTLDIELLSKPFRSNAFDIKYISITDITNIEFNTSDILIYTSSHNPEVRQYLKDILYYIKDKCLLVPKYEILLGHENKGFQEVMRKELGITRLSGEYFFDIEYMNTPTPFVLKTPDGSGSSGVNLIKNATILKDIKKNVLKTDKKRNIKNIIRSKQLSNEQYLRYLYVYKNFKRYVAQPFLDNLTCDYRILAIQDRFYAMRRDVKKGDFRASGSKRFHYHDVPIEVLAYAKEISSKVDNPYLSIDLAFKNNVPYLIEFQGTNFGSSVVRNSKGYYTLSPTDEWEFHTQKPQLEEALSHGLYQYIQRRSIHR